MARGHLSLCLRLVCAFAFCTGNLYTIMSMGGGRAANYDMDANITVAWTPLPSISAERIIDQSSVDVGLIELRLNETYEAQNKSWESAHHVPHFFVHTPKTGGFSLHDQLNDMIRHSPRALPLEGQFRLSEAEYDGIREMYRPRYAYALIRNPRTHVLSQYFHCKESDRHAFGSNMPSLDEWLTRWYAAINNPYIVNRNDAFKCYNPINMQSAFVGFHPEKGDAMQTIQRNYTVIGPLDEIDKVACVMFIHWAGWIPRACNCTTPHTSYAKKLITNHSVTHHGSTFNTTNEQEEKIEWLVEKDNMLYDYAKTIFDVQARVIEERYGFKLCEKAGDFAL